MFQLDSCAGYWDKIRVTMRAESQTIPSHAGSDSAFQNTLWSQVYAAGGLDASTSEKALEILCRTYWKPIYFFLLRSGKEHHQAKDLTQGFFAYVLEKGLIQTATREKGRFRSFLLGVLKHFVSNERRRHFAEKRGGRQNFVSLDQEMEDAKPRIQPATDRTPDQEFERRWALDVLAQALERLKSEYERAGCLDLYRALHPFLSGENPSSYRVLAEQLGKTEDALRTQVTRFRRRFRDYLRAVIADTLSDLSQLDEELEHFKQVLRGS